MLNCVWNDSNATTVEVMNCIKKYVCMSCYEMQLQNDHAEEKSNGSTRCSATRPQKCPISESASEKPITRTADRLNPKLTLLTDDVLDLDAFATWRRSGHLNLVAGTALTSPCPRISTDCLRWAGQVIQQGVLVELLTGLVLEARPWEAEPLALGNVAATLVLGAGTGASAGALLELAVDIRVGG